MNYTRKDLIQTEAAMNQMRNSVYFLARFMEKNGVTDTIERMRRIGRNIARTFVKYWQPNVHNININNVKDVMTTIYQKILNSTISIEMNGVDKLIIVKDNNCSLCRYRYSDVEISGCEIIMGMVSEIVNLVNKNSRDDSSIFLEPYKIVESRAYGNNTCIQTYKYIVGK
jgi:hypothetical protein